VTIRDDVIPIGKLVAKAMAELYTAVFRCLTRAAAACRCRGAPTSALERSNWAALATGRFAPILRQPKHVGARSRTVPNVPPSLVPASASPLPLGQPTSLRLYSLRPMQTEVTDIHGNVRNSRKPNRL